MISIEFALLSAFSFASFFLPVHFLIGCLKLELKICIIIFSIIVWQCNVSYVVDSSFATSDPLIYIVFFSFLVVCCKILLVHMYVTCTGEMKYARACA